MTDKPITPLPLQGLSSWLHHMAYKFPEDGPTLIAWAKESEALIASNAIAQGMVPEGWKLVPATATVEQRLAMAKADGETGDRYRNMARAFLASAPTAPIPAVDAVAGEPVARVYGSQYTQAQREWCQRYERETTFEPLMCDFEAGNISFLEAAKESRKWFEDWSNDAYLRGCDNIPGEMEALHEEITGEKP